MILDHPDVFHGNADDFLASPKRFYACPVAHARNILALPFKQGKGHPFTEGLSDFRHNRAIKAHGTLMARFYERYQPKTLLEAFFTSAEHPLLQGIPSADLQSLEAITTKIYLAPWVDEAIAMGGFGHDMPEAEGSHYLGPVSERHLTSEFARLHKVMTSIEHHSFDIDKQTDTIRGYFLFHKGDTVCVIVGGNHRVGALAALESPFIPVESHPQRPTFVTLDTLESWPMVQNGTFSKALATAVFLRFFYPSPNVIT